jgi:predicted nucleic acid-binding protein
VTLDAGALIAFERGDQRIRALVQEARATGASLGVPAAVLAQVWRDGARQARLAALAGSRTVEVVVLDTVAAKAVGRLCGLTGTADVVDASVVLAARTRSDRVVTSDPADLAAIDPGLELLVV